MFDWLVSRASNAAVFWCGWTACRGRCSEPTQGMSPAETAEFDGLIKSLAGRVTILLIEHDIELVMSLSDHVVVMHQGEKLFEGSPDQVRSSSRVREAYLGVDHAAA